MAGSYRTPQRRGFAADWRGNHGHEPSAMVPRSAQRGATTSARPDNAALAISANIEGNPAPLAVDGEPLIPIKDVLCGGIAVLLVLPHAWLAADPARMAWCRRKLQAILQQPPTRFRFDAGTASGECKWDTFAAE